MKLLSIMRDMKLPTMLSVVGVGYMVAGLVDVKATGKCMFTNYDYRNVLFMIEIPMYAYNKTKTVKRRHSAK